MESSENVIAFNPFPSRAHQFLHEQGLTTRIWKHIGSEGINVHDEALKEQLVAMGCKARAYQPEAVGNPERTSWEVILPAPVPPAEEAEPGEEGGAA